MSSSIIVTSLRVNTANKEYYGFPKFPTFPMKKSIESRTYGKYGKRAIPYAVPRSGYYHGSLLTIYIYSNLLIYIGLLKGIVRELRGN